MTGSENATGNGRTSRVEAMAELIKRLCLALTNVDMFSADHPVARHGIDQAYAWLRQMLDEWGEPVIISVAGAAILLDGLPLEERNPLVNKLARRFDEVHINNIFFDPPLSLDEFREFYRLLGRGSKAINAEGGFGDLLQNSTVIRNIHLKDVSYVMVTGDEKIVSKDAHVVEPDEIAGVSTESDIVKYMVTKLLEKADEQKWLINEIKNNPTKMADMITQGIDLAMSRAELGRDTESGIGTLINNIRLVGEQLLQEQKEDDSSGGREDLERALLALEREMKLRSSKLMSSKVATGFVNEIMSVVTTYADRVRAKQISDEFLKGERSLKQAEQLLRKLAPDEQDQKDTLLRLADQLVQRGMTEEDIKKMLDQLKKPEPAKAEQATAGKEKKPVAELLREGIEKKLEAAGVSGDKLAKTVKGILPYIEAAAREKVAEAQKHIEVLQGEIEKEAHILREVPIGIVTWNADGKTAVINAAARSMLKKEMGMDCSAALERRLKEWTFPLTDVPDLMKETDLTNDDVNLLLSVAKVMKDKNGEPYGVILLPLRSTK